MNDYSGSQFVGIVLLGLSSVVANPNWRTALYVGMFVAGALMALGLIDWTGKAIR